MSGGIKYDNGKPRMDLLPGYSVAEIAKVLTFGAQKYTAHNWRAGMNWSRLVGAAMRHMHAFNEGEDTDPESGISHLAHAGCCIMFLLEYTRSQRGFDDRFKSEIKAPKEVTDKLLAIINEDENDRRNDWIAP